MSKSLTEMMEEVSRQRVPYEGLAALAETTMLVGAIRAGLAINENGRDKKDEGRLLDVTVPNLKTNNQA